MKVSLTMKIPNVDDDDDRGVDEDYAISALNIPFVIIITKTSNIWAIVINLTVYATVWTKCTCVTLLMKIFVFINKCHKMRLQLKIFQQYSTSSKAD